MVRQSSAKAPFAGSIPALASIIQYQGVTRISGGRNGLSVNVNVNVSCHVRHFPPLFVFGQPECQAKVPCRTSYTIFQSRSASPSTTTSKGVRSTKARLRALSHPRKVVSSPTKSAKGIERTQRLPDIAGGSAGCFVLEAKQGASSEAPIGNPRLCRRDQQVRRGLFPFVRSYMTPAISPMPSGGPSPARPGHSPPPPPSRLRLPLAHPARTGQFRAAPVRPAAAPRHELNRHVTSP